MAVYLIKCFHFLYILYVYVFDSYIYIADNDFVTFPVLFLDI